jgi:hypothetical protein
LTGINAAAGGAAHDAWQRRAVRLPAAPRACRGEKVMDTKELLQRGLVAVAGVLAAGAAAAHPGHDHASWMADVLHLLHALAPLLALLAVGVACAAIYGLPDRERSR